MEFENITAEQLIAALIYSNGGELRLTNVAVQMDYSDKLIQIVEDPKTDTRVFTLVDSEEVNNES